MAIGTIAVLLVIVVSLAITYIRESKLSRYSYDEVIASVAAEGKFEYGMLKARNHRDGFDDAVSPTEPDGHILDLSTPRSSWLNTEYVSTASSKDTTFSLSGSEHLIIPLFVASGSEIGVTSKDPAYNTGIVNTTWLNISWLTVWGTSLSWTIVAMSGSESIAITGVGDIDAASVWTIRVKTRQCYSKLDGLLIPCSSMGPWDEEILYSYDNTWSVLDFLRSDGTIAFGTSPNIVYMTIIDPYFILYNPNTPILPPISVRIQSTSPFSLPTFTLRATASKWESSQIFQFTQDKSKYYDALKYGVYNTSP